MFWFIDTDSKQTTEIIIIMIWKKMNLKYHEGNGTNVVKILPHNTAMEFGMSDLQRDI